MASEALVELRVEDGGRLVSILDAEGIAVRAAFWLFSSEWGEWRLMLASPLVDQEGPRKLYGRIQEVLRRHPEICLRLDQITVVGLRHPQVNAVRAAVSTGHGISGIRLTNNVFNGVLIEDAYLYRSS